MTRVDTLADLVVKNNWTLGIEVGVLSGSTSFGLLEKCPILYMIGVDSYKHMSYKPKNMVSGDAPHSPQELDAAKKHVIATNLIDYPHRFGLINMDSQDAAAWIKTRPNLPPPDFVFLDADHHMEHVVNDYRAWSTIVKPEGMIIGADADWPSIQNSLTIIAKPYQLLHGNLWMIKASDR